MSVSHIASFSAKVGSIAVTPAGFGVPLLVGYHANFPENVKTYTGDSASILDALVTDGFVSGSAIHEMARVMLSQTKAPRTIKVGRLDTVHDQTITLTPLNVEANSVYSLAITLNGVTETATFTADATPTAAEIATGLHTAVNAFTTVGVTSTDNTGSLTLNVDTAGDVFRMIPTVNGKVGNPADMDLADDTTAPAGLAARLATITADDNDWYTLVADLNALPIGNIYGDYVASLDKTYFAGISDSDATESGTSTDLMSVMVGDSNDRVLTCWDGAYNGYMQCALAGKLLPETPGSISWVNKTLRQVTAPSLSPSLFSALDAKKYTVYRTVSSTLSATRGAHVGGTFRFIDVTRGLDWTKARSSEAIANLLLSSPKVDFTQAGIGSIGAELQSNVVDRAIANGLFSAGDPDSATNPPPQIVLPRLEDITAADKQARQLRGIKITAVLAGAIDTVISGEIIVSF